VKITDLHIDGFGVWSDLKLDQFSDGCTVFFGQNEAGKTTLMEFIRSVLYGFSVERRNRYLPPVHGGDAGGSLTVVGAAGRFLAKRTPGNALHGDDPGKLEMLSPNGVRQGQHVLGTMLSGIDEAIFNNVFALGLRELQELNTLNDTEAAAHLYKLTSGMDRVSLLDVMRDLDTSRNQLLAADGSPSELPGLIDRREKLRAEIKDLAASGQRWAQLAAQRNELQEEVTRLEENIRRMERESRAVEVGLQARDDWFRREAVAAHLAKLGPPIKLPERAVERMDELNAQLAQHREEVEQIKRARRLIVDEALAQPLNRQIWSRACRIEAVCEHGPWLASLEDQIGRLREDIEATQGELRARWEKLGLAPEDMPEFTPDLSDRVATVLRGPARAVRDANKRLQDAKAEHEEAQREAEDLREQLSSQLSATGRADLNEALQEAGNRVAMIRRRLQLEERLENIQRHRKEMEEDRRDLLANQILPAHTLFWCGVPFITGVAMVLGSLYWNSAAKYGWTITIVGAVCWAVAVAVKIFLEQAVSDDLEGCNRQYSKLKSQVNDLQREREELDALLPAGGGPLDSRLLAAEEYVKQLEELTPLEAKRQAALQRAEAVKDKTARASDHTREARDQWREALRNANLPVALTPEHVQYLAEGNDQTLDLGRRLQARREELQQRQTEQGALTGRIKTLFDELQMTAASDDPRARLRQLQATINEQKRWIERRRAIKAEHRDLRKRFREHAREVRKLLALRRVLVIQAKAADETHLRKLAARQAKIEELTAEHKDLSTRIGLAIGTQCTEDAIAEVLDAHREEKAELEQYWDRLLGRLQDAQERLTQLHQTRGEMMQEMKMLAENRRLPAAKLELGCVEEQIRRTADRWQVLAVSGLMLEDIRQIYETERQPETLAEASTHLARLTEGRYKRIWTPLSQDGLRLDTAEGESLPLDVLSTGTREAIFLSLRLALVAAYARRGALLPMVLDDVLVNLDLRRARAAAEVLRDFANSGHQMLLFTCHHHIVRIFRDAGVEMRVLPTRNGQIPLDLDEPAPVAEQVPEPEPIARAPVEEDLHVVEEPPVSEDLAPVIEEPTEEAEPVPVGARIVEETEPEREEPSDYDHTIWDDDTELTIAAEEERSDDPLEPAALGVTGRLILADGWWEHAVDDPAA
jgi:uncharacterized protein YhaN